LIETDSAEIEAHLGHYARFYDNVFVALNSAFLQEGAVILIPDGCIVEKPIELMFVSTAQTKAHHHPRVLIVTGKGSIANIVENYTGLNTGIYFSNAVTEIVLGQGSVMEHYKIQRESEQAFHIANTRVHQHRDSSYGSLSMTLGAELSRNELNVLLAGEGASCELNGLYLVGGIQHVDNQTNIDHAQPHSTSQELYKGILSGKSHAVFNGKIIVRKDAQRTDARQINKNLLLSDGARVNTKPQLEILADDVKCNHGATIGHLDEEAMFYLKSRGMSEPKAQRLLMYGFINDVLIRLKKESIREKINSLLIDTLKQFAQDKEEA
jgi:Fe-S cluster assembly protein SufD